MLASLFLICLPAFSSWIPKGSGSRAGRFLILFEWSGWEAADGSPCMGICVAVHEQSARETEYVSSCMQKRDVVCHLLSIWGPFNAFAHLAGHISASSYVKICEVLPALCGCICQIPLNTRAADGAMALVLLALQHQWLYCSSDAICFCIFDMRYIF